MANQGTFLVAKFHEDRGEYSSLILIKANKYIKGWTPVYVPRDTCEGLAKDDPITDIPSELKLTPMHDMDGEVCMTQPKDGSEPQPLMKFAM